MVFKIPLDRAHKSCALGCPVLNSLCDSFKQSCFTLRVWGVIDRVPDILGIILRDGHDQSTGCRRTPDVYNSLMWCVI
ncbi:hypothetical protein HanIR_Chr08g0353211 [Helianthus annuus]|nr:hypothetical protein HanIR_Chr08g0353211 [Helianthus annuus]